MSGSSQQVEVAEVVDYRLDLLDLPKKIIQMIHCPHPPSPADNELLEEKLRRYQKGLEGARSMLDLEEEKGSHLAQTLRHVEAIAEYRVIACMSVKAAWRKLPIELWDKVFASYLEDVRIQAGKKAAQKEFPSWVPPPPVLYAHYPMDSMGSIDAMVFMDEEPSRSPSPEDGTQADLAGMNTPYSLLGVCHAWKAAVLSSTSIWTNVTISTVAKETPIGTMPFVALADTSRVVSRLRRISANPTAWSLTILGKHTPESSGPQFSSDDGLPLSSILLQAEPPFGSVERLKIVAANPANSPYLGQVDFHSTTSLVVFCRSANQEHLGRPLRVPKLKKVVLVNAIELSASQLPPGIPWSQLTHLLLGGKILGPHIRGLLAICKSLCQASFRSRGGGNTGPDDAWYHAHMGSQPTMSSLKFLNVIGGPDDDRHLSIPLVGFSFPALTKLRVIGSYGGHSQLARYLQPFENLTHLSLIVFARGIEGGFTGYYNMGVILESCPLLVELVASVEGEMKPFLRTLVFHHERPRAIHLRVLALLCDFPGELRGTTQFRGDMHIFRELHNLVASRRQSTCQTLLDRFTLRFAIKPALSGIYHGSRYWAVHNLKKAIQNSVQQFVDSGLKLSIETTNERIADFYPIPTEKHWDEGATDFVDKYWERSASF